VKSRQIGFRLGGPSQRAIPRRWTRPAASETLAAMRLLSLACMVPIVVACGGRSLSGTGPAPARKSSPPSYTEALGARIGARGNPTLVPRLQAAAEQAVLATGRAGAVVALSPETGAVLALFSVPGDRGDPLLAAQQPASTFKPFTALAALEAGAITKDTQKDCTGTYAFGGKDFTCSGKHGRETVRDAIVRSCNAFFYDVGANLDHARILEIARQVGFGTRTGIELPDQAGSVADTARDAEINIDPQSPVRLLDAIGHGEVKVTLLQLARAYAVFATGGNVLRLTLLEHPGTPAVVRTLQLDSGYLELIRGALEGTVTEADGTARAIAIPGFDFAAKTGTAEAPPVGGSSATDGGDDTWFVAYAPPRSPSVLVAVRVERGEAGRDAKAVGKQMLEAWRAAP
jgi:penicillin-binding protein 2